MRIATTALCCLVIATPVLVGSQKAGGNPLTGADYYEIETLYGHSLHDLETWADLGQAFARSFVTDGQLVTPSGTHTGRAAIAAYSMASQGRRVWLTNLHIEPSDTGVSGWAYVSQSQGMSMVEAGLYHDVLVKTAEGWRVKSRTYLPGTQWTRKELPDMLPSGNPGTHLTATDYAEIKNLVYRYDLGYDNSGPFDEGLLSIQPFTADALFERINGPTFTGQEIAGQSRGHKPRLHHWDSNFLISVSPTGAVSSFNYDMQFLVEEGGAPVLLRGAGLLHHRFVKTPAGWRINYRIYEAVGSTPQINWPKPENVPFSTRIVREQRAKDLALTGADYVEIEQLYIINNIAFDSGAADGRRYADTFTSDGVLVRGQERLSGAHSLASVATANTPGLHNWISNLTIDPTTEGARGRAYGLTMAIAGQDGVKQSEWRSRSTYDDVLVRTPQGWRFKQRTVTTTALP